MPKGQTILTICDWVDKNAYNKDCDDDQLFKYLYLIFDNFIRYKKAFTSIDDVEACCIFSATEIYYRYKSPRKRPDENGSYNRPIILNIYGYARKIARFMIYMYRQKFGLVYFDRNPDKLSDVELVADYGFNESICRKVNFQILTDFFVTLDDIPRTIKAVLKTTPYKEGTLIFNNLYVSCMITFLNSIIFKTSYKEFLDEHIQLHYKENRYYALLDSSKLVDPKLFNLDDYMRDYVILQVRRCRAALKRDLEEMIYSEIDVEALKKDLVNNILGLDEDDD